jgi:hypothetical protein
MFTKPLNKWVPRTLSPSVKQPECKYDQSLLPSPEFKGCVELHFDIFYGLHVVTAYTLSYTLLSSLGE